MTDTSTGAIALSQGITLTPQGAIIQSDVTLPEFLEGFKKCEILSNASLWALGDLLLYGESRGEWGEMYTQAIEVTQKSYSTMSQAVRLSKAYPLHERVVDVSWSHHREALAVKDPEERREALVRAGQEGLSREGLRSVISGGDPHPKKLVTCPHCGHQW
jgi:hypothetical protein